MNEARVRKLASEGAVELPSRVFKRFTRLGYDVREMVEALTFAQIKRENPFAHPDFTCTLGSGSERHPWDLVCVQTPDGRTVRIVGMFPRRNPGRKKRKGAP
ncbi:MAG: hypothetical protein QHI48_10930 [Bacteroidota bacterium]|nr:hypothetical protein [Bacteroidota bacterium]